MVTVDLHTTTETMRPAVLPDNRKLLYSALAVGLLVSVVGLAIKNYVVAVLPLIVLAVFPGLPIFFHLLYHLLVKIELGADRIMVTDYAGAPFVRSASRQQISFDEVCYVYYLEKEINILKNLRGRLRKFKISPKETDYTRQNLVARYRVSEATIRRFEESSQKALTDYTATGVLMELDEICARYDIAKQTSSTIKNAMKDDRNFNFEYVRRLLKKYPISSKDMQRLRDEFATSNTDVLAPFLLTKVNMAKYEKLESRARGSLATTRANVALVLSNRDGSSKVYLTHFHDLSERDLQRFIELINSKSPRAKFLMTSRQRTRLLGR